MGREITVILYHHVSSRADPLTDGVGGVIDPDLFAAHVRYFARAFDPVAADDLLGGDLPRRPLLVTFDDAYRSVLDVAGPILAAAGVPALFFMNAATVEDASLPIDNVISLPRVLELMGHAPHRCASVWQAIAELVPPLSLAQVRAAKSVIMDALGESEADVRRQSGLFMEPADVPRLAEFGIAVGNHTASHSFLRSLTAEELTAEIGEGRTRLEALCGAPVTHFSVPYGNVRDATPSALEVIRASGHRAIYLVHAKSNRFGRAPDTFYRTSLATTPVSQLPLRLGLLPLARSLRDLVR
jgi:peptidoglycan/xylan/chitin deacetylase (PgdA/CDA1 family)